MSSITKLLYMYLLALDIDTEEDTCHAEDHIEGHGWVLGVVIGLGCLLMYKKVFK